MSYATQQTDAANATFLSRVQLSLVSTAIAIANESVATALHNQRAALARQVLANPAGVAANMVEGVVADGVTNAASTDAAIDGRISAIWNAYAS